MDFRPAASTDTSVTSASPIIRADAVEAVRAGLRIALPRARLPATPPIRVAGQPSTAASGGTSVFASIATPTNMAAAPTPIASRRWVVESDPTNRPISMRPSAAATVTAADTVLKRAKRDGASTAPSRTAEMGGTRVARSAGRSAAISVITTPTSSETMIVRVANTVAACGRSIPNDTNREFRPFARPRPRNSPATAATAPITSASTITERSTCRRVAPSVRSVASSRVRWAIVIDSVLAITKLPTNSATPPKASRKSWMMLRKPLVSFVDCWACPSPLRTCAFAGNSGRISLTRRAGEKPGLAATEIESSLPTLSNSLCATGKSKIAIVAPPSEDTPPIFAMPEMRNRCSGPRAITPIVCPTA